MKNRKEQRKRGQSEERKDGMKKDEGMKMMEMKEGKKEGRKEGRTTKEGRK